MEEKLSIGKIISIISIILILMIVVFLGTKYYINTQDSNVSNYDEDETMIGVNGETVIDNNDGETIIENSVTIE